MRLNLGVVLSDTADDGVEQRAGSTTCGLADSLVRQVEPVDLNDA